MTGRPSLMPVAEALRRIEADLPLMPAESIAIDQALGRVLAEDVVARVTQPPVSVSAMDGYAVRAEDVAKVPITLQQIGEAPAGHAFAGDVGAGETVRIFTGGPMPKGADAIVIQEDTEVPEAGRIVIKESVQSGHYVRQAGLDFRVGETLLKAGTQLNARTIGLCAAMNVPWVMVRRRPRIAILATGDEIVRPGEPLAESQIVSSNALALAAMIRTAGGDAIDLGIAKDNEASLRTMVAGVKGADMLVTLGGASVGDHDLVQSVLGDEGLEIDFWRIAMRPGKPLMFGKIKDIPMMGMPGNPVSSLVCGLIFLRPALRAMLGIEGEDQQLSRARLAADLPANDQRQDYLRAAFVSGPDGIPVVEAFGKQDSSMLSLLARSDCLVIRPPHAPPAKAGDEVEILQLHDNFLSA